jgi:hypothetical protein
MNYNQAQQQAQVAYEDAMSEKETIDRLLHIDAQMYASTGKDTTKSEMDAVKRTSAYIYRLIKEMDADKGQRFIQAMGLTR